MVASRARTLGASSSASFWFSAFLIALMPTSIGYQDLAALLAQQPGFLHRPSEHLIASPFGTIEPATFSYSRPIGTSMPEPLGYQTVNFDPRTLDAGAWKIDAPLTARPAEIEYPTVNRTHKGDREPVHAAPAETAPQSLPPLQPVTAAPATRPAQPSPPPVLHLKSAGDDDVVPPTAQAAQLPPSAAALQLHAEDGDAAVHAKTPAADNSAHAAASDDDIAMDKPPEIPAANEMYSPPHSTLSYIDEDAEVSSAQTFFGAGSMGSTSSLQRWSPGDEPVLNAPLDSGIKLAALEGEPADNGPGGETIAGKGDTSLMTSPAERLGLSGRTRLKAEKCLADAVYFEARGEPLQGQQAVAQVVMNRVFSGFYPNDVCGVVYQNSNRYLACQFTFACEGKDLNKIDEPDMWEQAKRIAKDTLDGKIWLAEVGHATHYHAYWVHPSWVHEMTRLYRLGVHTFYRPRNWGNGEDDWGPTELKSETLRPNPEVLSQKPEPAPAHAEPAKGTQASAAPAAGDKVVAKL